jgi:hypothetical protein
MRGCALGGICEDQELPQPLLPALLAELDALAAMRAVCKTS